MRIIKFRGKKCSDDKWVYGQYVEANRGWRINGKFRQPHKSWIVCSAFSNGGFFNVTERYSVKDDTVCQFTGLHDVDGKEIYEGDFLKSESGFKGFVKWNKNGYFFIKDSENENCAALGEMLSFTSLHVYGNIYDNPELIKEILCVK